MKENKAMKKPKSHSVAPVKDQVIKNVKTKNKVKGVEVRRGTVNLDEIKLKL
jgi:hypothetical protein